MFALSCIFTAAFTTGFYYDGNRHVKAVQEYKEEEAMFLLYFGKIVIHNSI